MCISVLLFLPCPPSPSQGLIKTRMHHTAFYSVSSSDIFMLNPPRKSPEGFEVLGCVNKDVTMVDTGLLNEDRRFDVGTLSCPKERNALQQAPPFSLSFFVFVLQGPAFFFPPLLYFLFSPRLSRRKGINERKCRENVQFYKSYRSWHVFYLISVPPEVPAPARPLLPPFQSGPRYRPSLCLLLSPSQNLLTQGRKV